MKAIAYCGLACCVCSENDKCIGCQNGGCDIHGWCKNYNCCREKDLNGCWECVENKPPAKPVALIYRKSIRHAIIAG